MFGKYVHVVRIKNRLPQLKKKFPHWNQVGSQALQDIAERLDFGYAKFFRKKNKRPPQFRAKRNAKSFTLKQAGWKLHDNHLKIGKHNYKFSLSRPIEGKIKTVTIKRNKLNELFVFFSCELEEAITNKQGRTSVGIDFGLKTFLTLSNGQEVTAEQFFRKSLKAVKKANQSLSRKKKGSSNRERARKHLARIHEKVSNQRSDFHWKLAHELVENYDIIILEDLNLNGMKSLWGRKVSDLGFYNFVRILEYVASQNGVVVKKIDRFFPSSKKCHHCNFIKADLELRDRTWICPCCDKEHNRDLNAAINIHREGASSLGLGDVSRSSWDAIAA